MSKISKKWNGDLIIKFFELYENHPCLWDVFSKTYKDRIAREDAYREIGNAMNIDGFESAEVKAKIRSLRNAYTLELAKIQKSKKSGAGVDDTYKPNVKWFPIAHRILHQVVQTRDSQSTEINGQKNVLNETTKDYEDTDDTEFGNESNNMDKTINFPSPSHTQNTKRLASKLNIAPKKSKTFNKSYINSTERAIQHLREISSKLDEKPEENEFDFFGKTIACMLKKIPETLAVESMVHIQSYLAQQRLKSTVNQNHQTSAINENIMFSPSTSNYNSYSSPSATASPINTFEYSSNENSQNTQSDILASAVTNILQEDMYLLNE
ncbi:uncharacterized protein LOC112693537 [Sipha flava]|uniref:Uncharacterized protein LOC112693537 n=1 Tax=Sipha flava TaxID=143950 RepID=A0A8B8GN56_9HEMI|nr:uncharacterized protein LOC112693537 [Sipha flava]